MLTLEKILEVSKTLNLKVSVYDLNSGKAEREEIAGFSVKLAYIFMLILAKIHDSMREFYIKLRGSYLFGFRVEDKLVVVLLTTSPDKLEEIKQKFKLSLGLGKEPNNLSKLEDNPNP